VYLDVVHLLAVVNVALNILLVQKELIISTATCKLTLKAVSA
jgi:hypothetical protein